MNAYEEILTEFSEELIIDDFSILPEDMPGYYEENSVGKIILINKKLKRTKSKICVLAEELGHYHMTVGDITDQSKVENRKQELKARRWGYEKLVSIEKLVQASEQGIRNRYELAEYIGVTEEFLEKALAYYREKHGTYYKTSNYIVYFDPLWVYKKV
ncbi:protein of unknown function [Geosporobacter subterraneus DSM 17957]|uniref:IrrE N-terminal-like domain-containing protein n=1 Tax=Geosporobacter subterraneus DSM 17957 TaxID=1121919 RepID=A0A1M6DU58_9FIRM|nr:ImmA/IrrE family metallo-endopeptidase [Geosporobacter subterraneus]SHI76538.1 protein of unknown function [Geosporobacter subterraneus DSM 17957]